MSILHAEDSNNSNEDHDNMKGREPVTKVSVESTGQHGLALGGNGGLKAIHRPPGLAFETDSITGPYLHDKELWLQ